VITLGRLIYEAANTPTSADWLAAWGQVGGAIATFAAVVVALWLARRERGRIKVKLKVGALADNRSATVTAPPSKAGANYMANLAAQGFSHPIVAVEVVNVGGQPVTIKHWSLSYPLGPSLGFPGGAIGPALPHRMDVGETAEWVVDAAEVRNFMEASMGLRNSRRGLSLRHALRAGWMARRGGALVAEAELADGRRRWSAETLR
jgi:hypothetical protein